MSLWIASNSTSMSGLRSTTSEDSITYAEYPEPQWMRLEIKWGVDIAGHSDFLPRPSSNASFLLSLAEDSRKATIRHFDTRRRAFEQSGKCRNQKAKIV
jgi:hypothetical protein